jgi:hypothetical protein
MKTKLVMVLGLSAMAVAGFMAGYHYGKSPQNLGYYSMQICQGASPSQTCVKQYYDGSHDCKVAETALSHWLMVMQRYGRVDFNEHYDFDCQPEAKLPSGPKIQAHSTDSTPAGTT